MKLGNFLNPLDILKIMSPTNKLHLFQVQFIVVLSVFLEISPIIFVGPFAGFVLSDDVVPNFFSSLNVHTYLNITDRKSAVTVSFLFLATILIISAAISVFSVIKITKFANFFGISISNTLFKHFLHKDWKSVLQTEGHDTVNKIMQETERLTNGVIFPLMMIIAKLILLLSIVIFLCFTNLILTISVSIGFFFIYAIIFGLLFKTYHTNSWRITKSNSERYRLLMESVEAGREIRLLKIQEKILSGFFVYGKNVAEAKAQNTSFSLMPKYIIEAIALILLFSLLSFAALLEYEVLTTFAPDLLTFLFAGLKILPILQSLFRQISLYSSNSSAFFFIRDELLKSFENKSVPADERVKPNEKNEVKLPIIIQLQDVSFQFEGANSPVISNLNLEVGSGEVVVITGASGAGKSSLLDIITGLLEPTSGQVLINGMTHQQIQENSKKELFGYAGQSSIIFNGTLLENITIFDTKEGYDRIKFNQSIENSSLDKVLQRFAGQPDEIVINERSFSGGENQRISLARALYTNAKIMILDEPTNGLDKKTEAMVASHLLSVQSSKIVVIVTHSRFLMENCKRLLLLENGNLKEISFDEVPGVSFGDSF